MNKEYRNEATRVPTFLNYSARRHVYELHWKRSTCRSPSSVQSHHKMLDLGRQNARKHFLHFADLNQSRLGSRRRRPGNDYM